MHEHLLRDLLVLTRTALAALLALPVLALTACGGPSDHDVQQAKDFCASEGDYGWTGANIDPYTNTDGYDRCVKDATKVDACLDEATFTETFGMDLPATCD